jgi:predicted MFS family arabinose efflux permease
MDVIEPPPSPSSLRGLDAVNLFLAGALSGFGPYVAVFLAEQKWTEQNIGFVLTAGGLAGLLSQLPSGELLDAIRSKRLVVALIPESICRMARPIMRRIAWPGSRRSVPFLNHRRVIVASGL